MIAFCTICGDVIEADDVGLVETFEASGGEPVCPTCGLDDDGQPDEREEWSSFDPDC